MKGSVKETENTKPVREAFNSSLEFQGRTEKIFSFKI